MQSAAFITPDFSLIIADLLTGTADAGTIYLASYHYNHGYDFDLLECVANATPESVNDLFPMVLPLIIELLQAQFQAQVAFQALLIREREARS